MEPEGQFPGPLLSLEQAGSPVDFTGTVLFDPGMGDFQTRMHDSEDDNATRLTDDEHYQIIQTVLHQSITSTGDDGSSEIKPTEPSSTKTGSSETKAGSRRPEVSQSLRLQHPLEERTSYKLPSRSLSVPTDSASLEKKLKKKDDYSLDSKDYQIVAKVGEGGSGVVYEANQLALKRRVAVKVLKQRRTKKGSKSRTRTKELEKRRSRFLHEVNITAKLQHPNIIPLYDLGANNRGEVFYAMKLISEDSSADAVQQSWASMVRTKPKENSSEVVQRNVEIFEKVCDAMRYAHAENVVHRDLKPENVMVGEFGEVLVIDWGMALDLTDGPVPFTAGGTTSYMAPEMALHYLKQSEMHKLSQEVMSFLPSELRDEFAEISIDVGGHAAAKYLMSKRGLTDSSIEMAQELVELAEEETALSERVNFSSDIYLLGAILYEIAVGHPPHYVPRESCESVDEKHHREFWLSSNHHIQRLVKIEDPLRLSLCNIALRALRLAPEDRFQSVDALKESLKDFKNQVQSLQLIETGRKELEAARGGEGYQHLLPALESFRGAATLYPLADDAKQLKVDTICEYAQRADRRKDFDAGLSIIDEYSLAENETETNPEIVALSERLHAGKRKAARNRTLAQIGWVAAIVLPLGVWGLSWMATADLRSKNDDLRNQTLQASADLETKQSELVVKEKALLDRNQELASKGNELIAKQNELASKVAELTSKTNELDLKTNELASKTAMLTTKETELAAKTTQLDSKTKLLDSKTKLLDSKTIELTSKTEELNQAEKRVETLRSSSAVGQFNSLLLPIPLDLRKGKLELARKRLEDLKTGDLDSQFKNGWLARHFAKVLNVSGVNKQLGDDASVFGIVHTNDTNAIAIGTKANLPTAWEFDAKTGEAKLVELELPQYGKISHVAVSADKRWLALAIDNVAAENQFNEYVWVVDLATGKRAKNAMGVGGRNESIVGCKLVEFVDDGNGSGMKLVTVEEISGYRGLKQRLQIATRRLDFLGNEISMQAPKVHPISATSRDQGRVRYAAALGGKDRLSIALVYQSLDRAGRERLVMESLIANGDSFAADSIVAEQFPTAMDVGANQVLTCGYADGRIDQYLLGQLSVQPVRTSKEAESAVVALKSTPQQKVVAGSKDGVLILFDKELNAVKRLLGQEDEPTALAVAAAADGEIGLISGGATGNVRVWKPDGTLHDASISKGSQAGRGAVRVGGSSEVTCGAVDQGYQARKVPATAYGTADGRVFYFDAGVMQDKDSGQEILPAAKSASLSIDPLPGSFDSTFANFDSLGIVNDEFVLLQSDGRLYATSIDTKTKLPSASISMTQPTGANLEQGYIPVLASQPDQTIFFSNNAADGSQLLYWAKNGDEYRASVLGQASSKGKIKRLSLSPNGQWLAVVREQDRQGTSGRYVTEVMEVGLGLVASSQPMVASRTNSYRVGDPAFVGFSDDSNRLVLHFHKSGVDRETWTETWARVGNRWQEVPPKRRIDERRVDMVAWDGQNTAITKINRQFYVVDMTGNQSKKRIQVASSSKRTSAVDRVRLKSVRPVGDRGQFVLFNQRLERFDRNGVKENGAGEIEFENARGMRVFGDRAIVLDDRGFHLVDEQLNYVSLIARRKVTTRKLALSNGRLAICYDAGGLCRVMNVDGENPVELGKFSGSKDVRLSPDGKWAASRMDDGVHVFAIDKAFDKPVYQHPIKSDNWAMQWLGNETPKLLVGQQANDVDQLQWQELDLTTGELAESKMRLPMEVGAEGQLDEFELSRQSNKYLSMTLRKDSQRAQVLIWAIAEDADATRMGPDHGFDTSLLNPEAVSFSELKQDDQQSVGTRLAVMSKPTSGDSAANSTRIFMLYDSVKKNDADGEPPTVSHRMFEIEGAIEATDGRKLLDAAFSGDGRTLLEVDDRGVKALLSKDW